MHTAPMPLPDPQALRMLARQRGKAFDEPAGEPAWRAPGADAGLA